MAGARSTATRAAGAMLVALAAACDGTPGEPEPAALAVRDIVLTDTLGAVVAYSHEDHWHGIVRVRPGETRALRAYLTNVEAGHDAPEARFTLEAHPDHALRVTSSDADIATWTGDRFALTVRGVRAGTARTDFVVVRGATRVYDAPRVGVIVGPD